MCFPLIAQSRARRKGNVNHSPLRCIHRRLLWPCLAQRAAVVTSSLSDWPRLRVRPFFVIYAAVAPPRPAQGRTAQGQRIALTADFFAPKFRPISRPVRQGDNNKRVVIVRCRPFFISPSAAKMARICGYFISGFQPKTPYCADLALTWHLLCDTAQPSKQNLRQ